MTGHAAVIYKAYPTSIKTQVNMSCRPKTVVAQLRAGSLITRCLYWWQIRRQGHPCYPRGKCAGFVWLFVSAHALNAAEIAADSKAVAKEKMTMKALFVLLSLLLPAMAITQDQVGSRYDDPDRERALLAAISERDRAVVKELLDSGVSANARTPSGWTALMSAADTGQADVARALLAAGADAGSEDERGWTALMVAMQRRHAAVADALLAAGADPTIDLNVCPTCLTGGRRQTFTPLPVVQLPVVQPDPGEKRVTTLADAVKRGDADQVKLLLSQGADANEGTKKGFPLMFAAAQGRLDLISLLLERGAEVNAVHHDDGGITALMFAAGEGHPQAAALLLDRGAEVNPRYTSFTPLIAAAIKGHLEVVTLLLKRGADANRLDGERGMTAGMHARTQRHTEIAEMLGRLDEVGVLGSALIREVRVGNMVGVVSLLERGADVNALGRGPSALMLAARNGRLDMARLLLERGADANTPDKEGITALMFAAQVGYLDLATLLLERGADVNAEALGGATALMLAAAHGHLGIVTPLLERGADVNAWAEWDGDDITSLILAAGAGHMDMVALLLERGADVDMAENGLKAASAAERSGHVEIATILREAMR